MKDIKIYTTEFCWFCHQAKILLERLKLPFEEIKLDQNQELRRRLADENNGFRTVPMIFIDNTFIGGFTELTKLYKEGKL